VIEYVQEHGKMLPDLHFKCYTEFHQTLSKLVEQLETDLDRISFTLESQKVQLFFRDQVCRLDLEALPPDMAQRSQSYQVEMDKQLRLLQVDVQFLQAARQPEKVNQRMTMVGDRLRTLMRYCDALLER
jgi:valyl-tRNA synthetase